MRPLVGRGFSPANASPANASIGVALGVLLLVAPDIRAQSQWQDVVRNLRHPSAATRLDAVEKLGESGYVQAIEPLAPLIGDSDDRVQAAAIDAELSFFLTERLGGGRVLGVGNAKSRAQQAFESGPLVRTATPAPEVLVDSLVGAIRDENARVRFDAIHALGFIAEGPLTARQIAGLEDGLDHYDPIIRAATARVIGRLDVREAGDRLRAGLEDSNSVVRLYAIESLGLLRERRALPGLLDVVQRTKNAAYVDAALLALGRIASPDDLAMFRQRMADKTPLARRAAIEGLGRLQDRDSLPAIEQAFKTDKSDEVRLAAAFALQMLGETQSHVLAANLYVDTLREQARQYLFELGRPAVPGIESALKVATDSQHRADLIQTVGYLGTKDDLAVVEPFLKDKDARVLTAATNAVLRLRR
jgi:HEAT repeat protein